MITILFAYLDIFIQLQQKNKPEKFENIISYVEFKAIIIIENKKLSQKEGGTIINLVYRQEHKMNKKRSNFQ